MPKPWEQVEGEPDLWYGRFHQHYLLVGTERSLDDAHRRHLAGRSESGREQASPRRPRWVPGSWRQAANRWRWSERARAYDHAQQAEERKRLQHDLFEARKKAALRHDAIAAAGLNWVIRQMAALDHKPVPASVLIPLAIQLIRIDRELKGAPIHVEISRRPDDDGPSYQDAADDAAVETVARFEATPEMYAAVAQVLAAQESKVYGDGEDAGQAEPDHALALADDAGVDSNPSPAEPAATPSSAPAPTA